MLTLNMHHRISYFLMHMSAGLIEYRYGLCNFLFINITVLCHLEIYSANYKFKGNCKALSENNLPLTIAIGIRLRSIIENICFNFHGNKFK